MQDSDKAIGPYRLLEQLGQGAMGVVYRARHVDSELVVALKTVKLASPRLLDSIRREIHALTAIRHPGVVRILDHGVHDGLPWYSMDLLEGESLRHFVRRIWSPYRRPSMPPVAPTDDASETEILSQHWSNAVPQRIEPISTPPVRLDGAAPAGAGKLRSVLQIMRRACATLAYLHGEGFVNCDLKPENILLVEGQPIIIDFGLTAQHPGGTGRESLEALRAMAGTLPYMSPEQLRGEFVDARSDLYAVGCILYELVTGAPPFGGAPPSIRNGHLTNTVTPPSRVVSGVPEDLEALILKLLAKDQTARFGFADEVANLLAATSDDTYSLSKYPAARAYLYRPAFVGRDDVIRRLGDLRDRASAGCGAIVLLGGESGVGKTRVAMETTRFAPSWRMQVVTSEATSLSAESGKPIAPAPLQVVRPLLQAVTDRCLEGGTEATERLVGERLSVLASYEPRLAQVPASAAYMAPAMPLAAEPSRHRLFKYLAETLAALCHEQPLLWLIDDLGWADELSLAFLRSLTFEYLESTPLLVLCTYRSEEPNDMVTALAALPHVRRLALGRLPDDAVSSMISGMLALRQPKKWFVEFISRQAEGNPFFVAEYLRTALTESLLYRDQSQEWQFTDLGGAPAPTQLPGGTEQGWDGRELLPLPSTLRELIDRRLQRLSPHAVKALLAAAVLGREVDSDLVGVVAMLPEETVVGVLDELIRRQVLEQVDGMGRVKFVHDKLREVTYSRAAAASSVRDLHFRAARALEDRLATAEPSRHWATVGYHFAAAEMAEPASRYLKLAADHARKTFANGEALGLYRAAIRQVDHRVDDAHWGALLSELRESLGDILSLAAEREEARVSYQLALARIPAEEGGSRRARLLRKLGKGWEMQHAHGEALRAYDDALACLAADPLTAPPDHRNEWIQIQVDRIWMNYWLDRGAEMNETVVALRPVILEHGSALQRNKYYQSQTLLDFRRYRYAIASDTVAFAAAAVAACREGSGLPELQAAQMTYSLALLLDRRFVDAETELKQVLAATQKTGDPSTRARCLTYLALASRMQGRRLEVETLARDSEAAATAARMPEYLATAYGNRAWLALGADDPEAARHHALRAVDIWRNLQASFPFQWVALLPLLRAALRAEDVHQAVSCAESLLHASQQVLPAAATGRLGAALRSWQESDVAGARGAMNAALHDLEATEYA